MTLVPTGPTTITGSWSPPLRDGGISVEKYRVSFSTDKTMSTYRVVDLPVVSEVQTVVAELDVVIETQALRVLANVTNERQSILTQVNGVDEVQTVSTTCDSVTNEVQRITTMADDKDEVQTVEITGDAIQEIQLVQSYTTDLPEVQVLSIYTLWAASKAKQSIGVILSGIDTSACTATVPCTPVEDFITGYFQLRFDPRSCGDGTTDGNWCVQSLVAAGFAASDYDCSATGSCTTSDINFKNQTDLVAKLCQLTTGTKYFMGRSSGGVINTCVSAVLTSKFLVQDATNGVYQYSYELTFESTYLRGKLPALVVSAPTLNQPVRTTAGSLASTYTSNDGTVTAVGDVVVGGTAFHTTVGNQPMGTVSLTYECESRTNALTVTVSNNGATITSTTSVLTLYQWVRIGSSYSQIVALTTDGLTATISPVSSQIGTITDAEIGVFFSDPTAVSGVSANCMISRFYTTPTPFSVVGNAANLRIQLHTLSAVIDNSAKDSVVVTRSALSSGSGYVLCLLCCAYCAMLTVLCLLCCAYCAVLCLLCYTYCAMHTVLCILCYAYANYRLLKIRYSALKRKTNKDY